MIFESQRSSSSFLWPISCAVLIPTPPSTPIDAAMPSLEIQLMPWSKPIQLRSVAVK
ncbi:Uncharacterised protein [Mycobacteroides abscessus subsp. abscessus]|nr:Uncharacterised protein [Mycobacteroides abscessus subsp. abscessus]